MPGDEIARCVSHAVCMTCSLLLVRPRSSLHLEKGSYFWHRVYIPKPSTLKPYAGDSRLPPPARTRRRGCSRRASTWQACRIAMSRTVPSGIATESPHAFGRLCPGRPPAASAEKVTDALPSTAGAIQRARSIYMYRGLRGAQSPFLFH